MDRLKGGGILKGIPQITGHNVPISPIIYSPSSNPATVILGALGTYFGAKKQSEGKQKEVDFYLNMLKAEREERELERQARREELQENRKFETEKMSKEHTFLTALEHEKTASKKMRFNGLIDIMNTFLDEKIPRVSGNMDIDLPFEVITPVLNGLLVEKNSKLSFERQKELADIEFEYLLKGEDVKLKNELIKLKQEEPYKYAVLQTQLLIAKMAADNTRGSSDKLLSYYAKTGISVEKKLELIQGIEHLQGVFNSVLGDTPQTKGTFSKRKATKEETAKVLKEKFDEMLSKKIIKSDEYGALYLELQSFLRGESYLEDQMNRIQGIKEIGIESSLTKKEAVKFVPGQPVVNKKKDSKIEIYSPKTLKNFGKEDVDKKLKAIFK